MRRRTTPPSGSSRDAEMKDECNAVPEVAPDDTSRELEALVAARAFGLEGLRKRLEAKRRAP